jgi:hypothetical protein
MTFTAGDTSSYVAIEAASQSSTGAALFVCVERASVGTFTVPGYITAALPSTTVLQNHEGPCQCGFQHPRETAKLAFD